MVDLVRTILAKLCLGSFNECIPGLPAFAISSRAAGELPDPLRYQPIVQPPKLKLDYQEVLWPSRKPKGPRSCALSAPLRVVRDTCGGFLFAYIS
jgi:hypothetical protein